jgi:hypothetical protein
MARTAAGTARAGWMLWVEELRWVSLRSKARLSGGQEDELLLLTQLLGQ